MKKILFVLLLFCFLSQSGTAYADTAKDLFSKYHLTKSTDLDQATLVWNKATSDYRDLLKDYAFTNYYNSAVSLANVSDISTELNTYQPMCTQLEAQMLSNIDADITEIISDENEYIKALNTVNYLLGIMDSYKMITSAPLPQGDLNALKSASESASLKRDDLTLKADIGKVKDIIQPIQAEYKVISKYGNRAVVGKANTTEFHHGIDLQGDIGTGVLSVFNGTVIYSDLDSETGETIKIDHGNGIVTVYENLRDRYVRSGDIVKQYQKIGAIGQTSKELSKPCLHLGLFIGEKSYDPDVLFRKE